MRRSAAALAITACLALVGCGEPTDGERAGAAVRSMLQALQAHDGAAACDHLTQRGISELLAAAVRAGTSAPAVGDPRTDTCARVAEATSRTATTGLSTLATAPVTRIMLDGDSAAIETHAGAYEAKEIDGRWRVDRLGPVVDVLAGDPPPSRPAHLTIVRPKLSEPAVGHALAGRTSDSTLELSGRIDPEDAQLDVDTLEGTTAEAVEARDGRFKVKLALRPGSNHVLLTLTAPGRQRSELAVRILRDGP